MTKMSAENDATRKVREIEHHARISQHAGEIWGWATPAGRLRVERRVELFKNQGHLTSDSQLLELGCGVGIFTEQLSKIGSHFFAIDLSPDLLEQAKKRVQNSRVKFSIQDAENLNFSDSFFDAVIGASILHHLRIETALAEIRRILKPNGRMVFSEPNMINPQVWMERKIPFLRKASYTSPDETAFVRWSLKKKIAAFGFRDVSVEPFDFLHPKTPPFVIPLVQKIGSIVEKIPGVREIAGSVIIYATKI